MPRLPRRPMSAPTPGTERDFRRHSGRAAAEGQHPESLATALGHEGQTWWGSCRPCHLPSARILGLPLLCVSFPSAHSRSFPSRASSLFLIGTLEAVGGRRLGGQCGNLQGLSPEPFLQTHRTHEAYTGPQPGFPASPQHKGQPPLGRPGHPASPLRWCRAGEAGDTCPSLPATVRFLHPHHESWWCWPRADAVPEQDVPVPAWCLQGSELPALCMLCVCPACSMHAVCVCPVCSVHALCALCMLHVCCMHRVCSMCALCALCVFHVCYMHCACSTCALYALCMPCVLCPCSMCALCGLYAPCMLCAYPICSVCAPCVPCACSVYALDVPYSVGAFHMLHVCCVCSTCALHLLCVLGAGSLCAVSQACPTCCLGERTRNIPDLRWTNTPPPYHLAAELLALPPSTNAAASPGPEHSPRTWPPPPETTGSSQSAAGTPACDPCAHPNPNTRVVSIPALSLVTPRNRKEATGRTL